MPTFNLSQRYIIEAPLNMRLFVSGITGTGKTTAGVERIQHLLNQGVPAETILLLTPQRTLQEPYLNLLESPQRTPGSEVTPATIGGLARRMCDLFWPIAAQQAGFKNPHLPPVFLTLETAQYYMAHLVRPLIEDDGYFESVTISRNRLYSQVIDNLNKAAVINFPHTEIGARLDSAWFGDPAQRNIYANAQECASLFRQYCLDHNLLDFSLQLEIFSNILWQNEQARAYLTQTYRHLIYDNVEEDITRSHDIIHEWMPHFESALLLYDNAAGYRKFLGGDPDGGWELIRACDESIELSETFVASENILSLSNAIYTAITQQGQFEPQTENPALQFVLEHFHPEMLNQVAGSIQTLLEQGTLPEEIVILSPYLSDSLRFSLAHRLEQAGIPWRSNRPSRSLRDEPASKTLLTLAALAHPHWQKHPPKFDVAHALMVALNTDLIRAQLLTDILYRPSDLHLAHFEKIKPEMQERITYALGARYHTLQEWITQYRAAPPLPFDFFLRKLFGEVLSQPEFGFSTQLDAVRVAASLVESVHKFRIAMEPMSTPNPIDLGLEYIQMLQEGVIAAQYLDAWQPENKNAILIAPAYTFLMMNRPATYQVWLDPGSEGWSQRVVQPLTHPYVLSRYWEPGRIWSDADETAMEVETLARLTSGLLARCRKKIFVALSDLGEAGFEQRGTLLRAFQKILQDQST